ncbi:hypothetical protein KG088_18600 [Halomonas sp. TRM85114]|uniref:hypothetical protein n=1 Tax=Halomonas jincaotanensis TaxID=2810616 RepID=UPI001BD3F0F3|nr:hypothetical protein [Halomonas jincaotanensis]MBS9405603.1 hypothetical protein [Halomonas jincaotanensis]
MNSFQFRHNFAKNAYYQQIRLSEETTVVAGFTKLGGTRSQPSGDGYLYLQVPKLDGHNWSFGLEIGFEGKLLPEEILEDVHFNLLLSHLVTSGHVYNTENAQGIIANHFRDTLENALKYVWEKEPRE